MKVTNTDIYYIEYDRFFNQEIFFRSKVNC